MEHTHLKATDEIIAAPPAVSVFYPMSHSNAVDIVLSACRSVLIMFALDSTSH